MRTRAIRPASGRALKEDPARVDLPRMGRAARVGRRFGAALFVLALCAAPAHAATVTFDVQPATFRGNPVEGEDPVLRATVPLPRGDARTDDRYSVLWDGGNGRCPSRVYLTSGAAPRSFKLRGGSTASRGSILLHTAAGDRTVPAKFLDFAHRKDILDDGRAVSFRLPDDLIPAYSRREVLVLAVPFPSLGKCPDKPTRRTLRILRTAVRHTSVTVPATYSPPPPFDPPKPIDLVTTPGLKLQQPPPPGANRDIVSDEDSASAVIPSDLSAAGDVNGDGLADAAVSLPYFGRHNTGIAMVVFGRRDKGTVQLGKLGTGGFRIIGPTRNGYALPVAAIGDLDGDGLGDLVVGAPSAAKGGGAAYVIRGQASNATVDLAKPGDRLLFKIAGGRPCRKPIPNKGGGDNIGQSVAGPGDVNGDGLPDVAVLAGGNCFAKGASGVYVVFSARDGRMVDIRHLGARGIRVPADGAAELANAHVAAAGDVNGDGLKDVAIATGLSGLGARLGAVILGQPTGGTIRQSALAFIVKGSTCEAPTVGAAGDVNGDGIGDLILNGGSDQCRDDLGRAYVIFGSHTPHPVDPRSLGDSGITIVGPTDNLAGGAVGAGDVNGDGLADVAIADENARVLGRQAAGEVFLVPGRREPGTIDLRYAGASVLAWGGPPGAAYLGISLAGLGDFDGDGRPDLLAGTQMVDGDTDPAAYLLPMP